MFFGLTRKVCEEISAILAKVWWGSGDKRGLHWYFGKIVCVPKREGGLEFKDFGEF